MKISKFDQKNIFFPFSIPSKFKEAPLAYDAVWSVALAFNRTMERLARRDRRRSLKDFTYTDAEIAGEIYAAMNSTSFLGVSVSKCLAAWAFSNIYGINNNNSISDMYVCVCAYACYTFPRAIWTIIFFSFILVYTYVPTWYRTHSPINAIIYTLLKCINILLRHTLKSI